MLNIQSEETKQIKTNLLNMYKQEMIGNRERKNNEKQQKIIEERKYLEIANLKFEEEKLKKQNEKSYLMNQRMEEYKNYMNNKGNNKFKNRFPQNNQINHGQENNNPNIFLSDNQNNKQNVPYLQESNLNHVQSQNYKLDNIYYEQNKNDEVPVDNNQTPNEEFIRQPDYSNFNNNPYDKGYNTVDTIGNQPNLLNYSSTNGNQMYSNINPSSQNNNINLMSNQYINSNNNQNVQSNNNNNNQLYNNNQNGTSNYYNPQLSDYELAVRSKKYEQQAQYKNFLDSQVTNNRQNRSQSSARNYENKYFPQKRNTELSINPFSNKNYEFGTSNLNCNPITNPMNNYGYNKYITPGVCQPQQNHKTPTSDKFQRAANNIIG